MAAADALVTGDAPVDGGAAADVSVITRPDDADAAAVAR